jgi:hypothetical protein
MAEYHEEPSLNLFGYVRIQASFVFRSDVEEHTKRTGHNNIYQYDLSSGKLLDRIEN